MHTPTVASPRAGSRETPVPAYLAGFLLIGLGLSVAGPALSHLRDRVHTTDGGIAWLFVGQSVMGSTAVAVTGGGSRPWSVPPAPSS